MSISRNILLKMSESTFLKKHVPNIWFVRKALKRFMPGETEEAAFIESKKLALLGIPTVYTRLGENIKNLDEADEVKNHYLQLIDKIKSQNLDIEISLKLTQLGFDISEEETYNNFKAIIGKANAILNNTVFGESTTSWIDIEGSLYTQRTIDFYKRIKFEFDNVGLCLQAYLYRTEKDLNELIDFRPIIRLVKGAYKEPENIAFPQKRAVDENYFKLSQRLMKEIKEKNIRSAFATHDEKLIGKIINEARTIHLPKDKLEFQMLYGIKPELQKELAKDGYKVRVLISYGASWYPWYMRRLAERPANVWFVLKNIF
ncbi:proline dehydrogenase family protein [Melioribacteraceae bacterium 4301-Me]|uniref:proline dehydrogenase family protein n=1 Tax=Pyranulibacter aquaticus TaxID=3163344 RepID=UPI003594BB02